MLEAEASFISRSQLLRLAEGLLQHTLKHILDTCSQDLALLAAYRSSTTSGSTSKAVQQSDAHLDLLRSVVRLLHAAATAPATGSPALAQVGLFRLLLNVSTAVLLCCTSSPQASQPFERISYAEALNRLREEGLSPKWGDDFGADEEKMLLRQIACSSSDSCSSSGRGLAIVDHPRSLKPFYMRLNEHAEAAADSYSNSNTSNSTVASLDILLPNAGEVLGGSLREERLDVLEE